MEELRELIAKMKLPPERLEELYQMLGVISVTSHRIGLSPQEEKELQMIVVEFIFESLT